VFHDAEFGPPDGPWRSRLHGHGGWRRGADGSVSVEASSVSEQAATYRQGCHT